MGLFLTLPAPTPLPPVKKYCLRSELDSKNGFEKWRNVSEKLQIFKFACYGPVHYPSSTTPSSSRQKILLKIGVRLERWF